MAEDFNVSSLVVPGTYIRVRAEGLIGVGGIATGNIGIVGTAEMGADQGTVLLADYRDAIDTFGRYDAYNEAAGTFNLVRGLELLYANGARTVYARAKGDAETYAEAFDELAKEDINIVVVPELPTAEGVSTLNALVNAQENAGKDLIAVVGIDATDVGDIGTAVTADKRLIMVSPGVMTKETLIDGAGLVNVTDVSLKGSYSAACVAGLLSSLTPQTSPTNKKLPAVTKLAQRFSYNEVMTLIGDGVLVLEERLGVRVVRGIGTDMAANGPFKQITTRRIVDFAKAGVRSVGAPFIGRLNNTRVRAALQGAIQGFLDTMVSDEALTGYGLEVTATRQDEINGRAIVNLMLQPTFSIEFLAVTIVLQ